MSYEQSGNFLHYFQPIITLAQNAAEVLKEIDIGASSSDHGDYLCVAPCRFHRAQFTLTSEAASGTSVAPTVVVTKQPTPLSSSGASAVAIITVPTGTGIGKTVYKDIEPIAFTVGDTIHIAWTIGTGTPTGQGVFSAYCSENPAQPAGNSDMIASA